MFIATNRFFIGKEFEKAFEDRWRNRQSYLDQCAGFMRFRLLKQQNVQGMAPRGPQTAPSVPTTEFISYTEWVDEKSFLGWMEGDQSKKGHSSQGPMPEGMVLRPPEFRAFTAALDEGYGHRTDYRSPHQDHIVEKAFSYETPEQREIFRLNKEKGLPSINIGAFEGRMLEILLRANGARRGVEIGTLGGYSATWLARALPADGKLTTIEIDPERAELARSHFARVGLSNKVEVKTGDALQILKSMSDVQDLDFVFIDADKANYGHYTRWAIPRLRTGGLLLADNAYIWGGMNYYGYTREELSQRLGTLPETFSANNFEGMSDCWKQLAEHPDMASLILPTGEGLGIGVKK